jgi:hypothetical protein
MHVRRYFAVIFLQLLFGITACTGGSGSSGFDAFPSVEDRIIQQALDENRCVAGDGVSICPAGTDNLDPTTPGIPPGRIAPSLDEGAVICTSGSDRLCVFQVPFTVSGFSPDAHFRIAVRTLDPNGNWAIGPELEPTVPSSSSFDAPVAVLVDVVDGTRPQTLQVAILVFSTPRAAVPAEVTELAMTAADFAFVTREISVTVR